VYRHGGQQREQRRPQPRGTGWLRRGEGRHRRPPPNGRAVIGFAATFAATRPGCLLDQRHATTAALHAELRFALREGMAAADIARSRQPEPERNAQVVLGGRDGGPASGGVGDSLVRKRWRLWTGRSGSRRRSTRPPALRVRQLRYVMCVRSGDESQRSGAVRSGAVLGWRPGFVNRCVSSVPR
jgi:hypothetical protein